MSNRSYRKCVSGKRGYSSHRRAMMAISRVAEFHPRADQLPFRAYLCRRCNRWHLSSKPKE